MKLCSYNSNAVLIHLVSRNILTSFLGVILFISGIEDDKLLIDISSSNSLPDCRQAASASDTRVDSDSGKSFSGFSNPGGVDVDSCIDGGADQHMSDSTKPSSEDRVGLDDETIDLKPTMTGTAAESESSLNDVRDDVTCESSSDDSGKASTVVATDQYDISSHTASADCNSSASHVNNDIGSADDDGINVDDTRSCIDLTKVSITSMCSYVACCVDVYTRKKWFCDFYIWILDQRKSTLDLVDTQFKSVRISVLKQLIYMDSFCKKNYVF